MDSPYPIPLQQQRERGSRFTKRRFVVSDALFWVFSVLMLASGLLVVVGRDPIHCAMALVFGLFCMAGLFVLLGAYFLAAVQVLVYAGAVMVLFLFVIMFLDLKAEARRKVWRFGTVCGVLVAALFICEFWIALPQRQESFPSLPPTTGVPAGGVESIGKALFTDYVLPFEITSLVLLVAMVGVVLLSKKELK